MKVLRFLLVILALTVLTGCLSFVKQDLTQYRYKNKMVKIGMTMSQVRNILGKPTHLVLPDPVKQSVSPDGIYEPMKEGQQYWHYGSIFAGDKEQLDITFTNGVVTKMRKFIASD